MDATVVCVSRLPNLRNSLDVAFCSIVNLHRLGSPMVEKVGSVGLEGAGAGKRRRLQASGKNKGHRSSISSSDSSSDSSSSSGSAEGGGGATREADDRSVAGQSAAASSQPAAASPGVQPGPESQNVTRQPRAPKCRRPAAGLSADASAEGGPSAAVSSQPDAASPGVQSETERQKAPRKPRATSRAHQKRPAGLCGACWCGHLGVRGGPGHSGQAGFCSRASPLQPGLLPTLVD